MADYDPHAFRNLENPINNIETFISLVKSAIGTGVLAMPMAFKNAGWLLGIWSTIFIGILVVYAIHILLHGIYEVSKRLRVPELTYAETMKYAIMDGPPCLRIFSPISQFIVNIFLITYHFGVCSVYVVFIASSIKEVADAYDMKMDVRLHVLLIMGPLIIFFFIRDIKDLVPFSVLANLLLFAGYGVVFYYVFSYLPPLSERRMVNTLETYSLFFGTVLFAVESVGVLIAIEAKMETPKDYLGLTGILNRGMSVVLALYTSFGFFGYWHYGDEVEGSVSLNLPKDSIAPQLTNIIFATGIFFSYALQGYVTIDVLWNHYIVKNVEENKVLKEMLLRTCMVFLTVIMAIIVPDLGLFISLVGSCCLSFLGLIFPAIIDICVKYNDGYGPCYIYLARDFIILIIGMVGGGVGTWRSIDEIIDKYQDGFNI